jgi:3-methyladenine DNA glycosylase AlkD
MNSLDSLKKELESLSNPKQAALLQGFFKTGKGEYGEGDIFLGIKVPVQRNACKEYYGLSFDELQKLLSSKIHEHRMCALFILVAKYEKAKDEKTKEKIFNFYLSNTKNINNWDLIDLSAPSIVGNYLLNKDRKILYKLAKSESLWEKRIAMLSTFEFIAHGETEDTFKIAEILLNDKHDLIHKAVGWMLREAGKRVSEEQEKEFLEKHYKNMPRTMLRYAVERLSEKDRKRFMG